MSNMRQGDVFGRARLPADLDRKARIAMLKKAAERMLEEGTPEGLYLAGALLSWLEQGGDLVRSFLKLTAPRGCHLTPQRLASRLEDDDSPA